MNLLPSNYDYRGNILSQVSFFWLEKLFWKGSRTTLKQDSLFPCPREQVSENLYQEFEKNWKKEMGKKNTRPYISIALTKTLKSQLIINGIFLLIEGLLFTIMTVLFTEFSSLFTNANNNDSVVFTSLIGYVVSIFIILVSRQFADMITLYYGFANGVRLQTLCTTILYRKILKLQQSTFHTVSIGDIINLISTETYKIQNSVQYLNFLWTAPLITSISTVLTLVYIGPMGLIGIGYLLLHVPIQLLIGWSFAHFSLLKATTGDKRIRLMDQIIRGMLVLKFYVWENSFIFSIQRIRKKELRYAISAGLIQSINFALFNTSLFIAVYLTYIASIGSNNPLSSSQLAFLFLCFTKIRSDLILYFGNVL